MLLMLSWLDTDDRILPLLRALVMRGLDEESTGESTITELLRVMRESDAFDGAIASMGTTLAQMGDQERGSILSTVARNTEFLESPPIMESLESSSFDPVTLNEGKVSIYLVLPEWRLATHSRWLRLIINSLMISLQRAPRPSKNTPATLFILDEFATLGRLDTVERATGYIAGFGVKLWTILQDLSQLKDMYPGRWETFLGNAGVLTAFGNADITTLNYLSARLGQTEVRRFLTTTSTQEGGSTSRAGLGRVLDALGSGLIGHSQKMTVAARATAEKKTVGQRS